MAPNSIIGAKKVNGDDMIRCISYTVRRKEFNIAFGSELMIYSTRN